jgi:CheY-like chemotaxis protein
MSAEIAVELSNDEPRAVEHLPVRGEAHDIEDLGAITLALNRSALELLVRRPRRRILVVEGEAFSGRLLASILGRWNFEVVTVSAGDAAGESVARLDRVDLAIAALPGSGSGSAVLLATLRGMPALEGVPVLAIARPEAGLVDFDKLREHGVVGVVSSDMSPEHMAFRVGQILPLGSIQERRHVRVPADFDVELEANGELTLQRAENLSVGGLRLRSKIPLEVNATVGLRFRLPLHPAEVIAAEARIIHCQPVAARDGSYAVGLFFRSMPARGRTLVELEIVRMLTGSING